MGQLAVVVFLSSFSAWAQAPEDSAAPPAEQPADAPKVEPAPAPSPAPTVTPAAPAEEHKVSLADRQMPSIWIQGGAGAVAALISVPVALYVGGWVGNLSNNVYVGLVSWLTVVSLLPSLAVTAAVVGIGNYYLPGAFPFWRVWGLTTVANMLATAVAWAVGVNVGMLGSIILFAICDAIVLPAVAVTSSRWMAKADGAAKAAPLASLEPWNPGATTRWFIPAAEVSF